MCYLLVLLEFNHHGLSCWFIAVLSSYAVLSFSRSLWKYDGLWTFEMQVIDYYKNRGVVADLRAEKPPKEVTSEVQKVLSS